MTWVAAISGIVSLIRELISGGKELAKFINDNKNEKWFQESAQVFTKLRQATPEERKNVAKNLRDLISGIGG